MQKHTTVGIATLVDREASFKRVIDSIYSQVDDIVAVLNNYVVAPDWTKDYPNLSCIVQENEHGDAGKFLTVDFNTGYYFSIDDDLIYHSTYISDMIAKIEQYRCIVTLHGKRFDKRPIVSYRKSFTTNVHCLHTAIQDTEVHVGGTGVMGFDTNYFKLDFSRFTHRNMADVFVAQQAHEQRVPIMAIAHKAGYLKYIQPPQGTTIWETSKDDPYPTQVLKSFLK